jgi:hypothetical protein
MESLHLRRLPKCLQVVDGVINLGDCKQWGVLSLKSRMESYWIWELWDRPGVRHFFATLHMRTNGTDLSSISSYDPRKPCQSCCFSLRFCIFSASIAHLDKLYRFQQAIPSAQIPLPVLSLDSFLPAT